MAKKLKEFFTNMPAKIVSEIRPIDPDNIPDFAKNFFESANDSPSLISLTNDQKLSRQPIYCNLNSYWT
jgi:hypothetical protein